MSEPKIIRTSITLFMPLGISFDENTLCASFSVAMKSSGMVIENGKITGRHLVLNFDSFDELETFKKVYKTYLIFDKKD